MSQKVNETLYQAENCMEEFPDSALSLLQHISHPEDLKGKAQADYALLYSQACDKNQISITNDSLIRIAVRYYEDKMRISMLLRVIFIRVVYIAMPTRMQWL